MSEVYPLSIDMGVELELPGTHGSNGSPGWEGDFSGQYDPSFADKNSIDPQYPIKIESMDRFAQARKQSDPSGSQGIPKRGNRTAPRGRTAPYQPPVQTTLKLERKVRKNTREKQRRQELNEKFDVLCNLLHLGRKTKAEKFTILSEAINLINALRRENTALKREKTKLYRLLQRAPPGSTGAGAPTSPKLRSPVFQPHSYPSNNFPPPSTLGLSITSDGQDDGQDGDPGDDNGGGVLHDDGGGVPLDSNGDDGGGGGGQEEDREDDLKLNFKLNMETDDTLDVPSIVSFPMPSTYHPVPSNNPMNNQKLNLNHGVPMNGYKFKKELFSSSLPPNKNNKFSPSLHSTSLEHSIIDGVDVDNLPPLPLSSSSLQTLLPPLLHPPFDFDISASSPRHSMTRPSGRHLSPTSARLDSPLSLSTALPSPLRSPFGQISSPAVDSSSQMAF